ncbi:MAG: hypothetical protein M1357_00535 [Candidatus Marsarchaeota archaeon]|nr:hypothetical protein [Candidatus Marsarchaeota archaeon]
MSATASIESNAKQIIQNILNQAFSFASWTITQLTREILAIMQPVSVLVFLVGLILWMTGLERRAGKRLMIGAAVIGLVSIIL